MVNFESTFLPAISLVSTAISSFNAFPFYPGFNVRRVTEQAINLPTHSWEYGATMQALLELYDPELSVFGTRPFPVPTVQRETVRGLAYVATKVNWGSNGFDALDAGNGAAGDPASMGVGAVMLGKTEPRFGEAANATVTGLLTVVPRFANGAISHRANTAELWADFTYMVPPFLAYYAADRGDAGLLRDTVQQLRLYRDVLQRKGDPNAPTNGAWMHIMGPESQDTGLWSSGNGWAAGGMARVLATVLKAPVAANQPWRDAAVNDLTQYIKEILDAAMRSPASGGLLRNYLDETNTPNGFPEISGSALLAATAYRMAVLRPQTFGREYTNWADGIRGALSGRDFNGNPHITETGIATPAVNPLWWKDPVPTTTGSPEGNAFVVLLYAGWRDCVVAARCTVQGEGNEQVLADVMATLRQVSAGARGLSA